MTDQVTQQVFMDDNIDDNLDIELIIFPKIDDIINYTYF